MNRNAKDRANENRNGAMDMSAQEPEELEVIQAASFNS
jgi:hypothetical protein